MSLTTTARVQITVEINVHGTNWNEHTSTEQLHREAEELAVARITDLCQRYVRLISVPKVECIISRKDRR